MKATKIIQSLGLVAVMATSAATFARGWDDGGYRPAPAPAPVQVPATVPVQVVPVLPGFPVNPGFPGSDTVPGFINHPAFQDSLRMIATVNERQERQLDRILGGVYERRISPMEFRKLMDEQRAIRMLERQLLADGFMTRTEFRRIDAALDVAARNIMIEARDRDGRPGYGGGYGWNRGYNEGRDGYGHDGWDR
jgi:hypothetical protein